MNLQDLRLFLAISEASSLSAAGRSVGLGASASSAALKRLEAHTDTRLVERSTRSLRLTPEGLAFLETCRQVLQTWDRGQQDLLRSRQALQGRLRVAGPMDLGERLLGPWLAEFGALHPSVELSLSRSDAFHSVRAMGVDVAVRYGRQDDSSLVARLLHTGSRVLVASPAYLQRMGAPEHPQALAEHRCLGWLRKGRPLDRWALQRGTERAIVDVALTLRGDGALVRHWALAGHGIAYKSELDVREDLRAGALRRVLPSWSGPELPLYALTPSRAHRTARVQALLDWLAQRLGTPP